MGDKESLLNDVFGWSVFVNLNSYENFDFILLKGHLLLEKAMEISLKKNGVKINKNYSFYRKTQLIHSIPTKNKEAINQIIFSLNEINKMRNNLAHDFYYKVSSDELISFCNNISSNIKGEEYSGFSDKDLFVHIFSRLSVAVLNL